jgi:alkylation response protein AidB-like acyl-CoA dehydrogenase
MNFGFTEDQEALRDATRKFLDDECPTTFVRKMMADDTAHATELWKKIAQLGWLGIIVPEEFGGVGGSFLDLVVILEEAGKSLLPGPFFATALLGTTAILGGGSAEQKSTCFRELLGQSYCHACLGGEEWTLRCCWRHPAAAAKATTLFSLVRSSSCRTRMSRPNHRRGAHLSRQQP